MIQPPKLLLIPKIPHQTKQTSHSDKLSDTISLQDIFPLFLDLLRETWHSSDQSSVIISSALLNLQIVYCMRSPNTNVARLMRWSTWRNEPVS